MTFLLDKTLWALSPEALAAVTQLEALGIDRDLAILTLEKLVGEDKMYDIEGAVL